MYKNSGLVNLLSPLLPLRVLRAEGPVSTPVRGGRLEGDHALPMPESDHGVADPASP